MAIRTDISINWDVSPRIITVDSPSVEITMQDLYDTLRSMEPIQIDEPYIIAGAGKEPLGGGVVVGLTLSLNNALIAFEARSGPSYILCRISGGNLVAFDFLGDPVDSPLSPTAFTSIVMANSSSATLQELDAIQFASYNGGITIDVTNGTPGENYPSGTPRDPVDNINDMVTIQINQGLPKVAFIIDDLHITEATPELDQYTFYGQGMDRTTLEIDPAADIDNCAYFDAHVTGTLDGDSRLDGCFINNLIYIKGFIQSCVLSAGTIVLGGSETAHFLGCYSGVPGSSTPIIDMGGSGQALAMRGYNGGIELRNKTGTEAVSIDLSSGQVVLHNTITNGQIVVRGVGKLIDSNGDSILTGSWNGATIINETINNQGIAKDVWDEPLPSHIIQDSAATALKSATYLIGSITLDTVRGVAGTGWPTGTHFKPSNNLTDALTIMGYGNVDDLILNSGITIGATHNISNKVIRTFGRMGIDVTLSIGCTANNTTFKNINLSGVIASGNELLIYDSSVGSLENFRGIMKIVSFTQGSEITLDGWANIIQGSAGGDPTNEVEINIGTASLNMSHWTGNLKLMGKTGVDRTVINCDSGNIIIDDTCTAGTIQILGTGTIESDNSGPNCTVDLDGFTNRETIADAVWDKELP